MRSALPLEKPDEPAAKPAGAFPPVWLLLQQIWALAWRGESRRLDDMRADAEAQLVAARRDMMADDPEFAHLAGPDVPLAFNGREDDLVPVEGCPPPTRFEDHESLPFSLTLEIPGSRCAWPRMTPLATARPFIRAGPGQ